MKNLKIGRFKARFLSCGGVNRVREGEVPTEPPEQIWEGEVPTEPRFGGSLTLPSFR